MSKINEQHLMRELSGLQPELKVNVVTPDSVTSLENYWRALANTQMRPPLFLQLFHRQWTLVGQYNGEVVPSEDLISESLWPVLARILRYRVTQMLSVEKGREWAANSGLMLLTAARQAGMLFEQVRDNDIAMIIERQDYESDRTGPVRRALTLTRSAAALAVFLLALYLAYDTRGGAVQLAAGTVAVISAIVLAVFVARID